jgi:hypothetical protein
VVVHAVTAIDNVGWPFRVPMADKNAAAPPTKTKRSHA